MSKREQKKFIKMHFSKQCRVLLVDVMKTSPQKRRRTKQFTSIQKQESLGRKKYSCYICFDKFSIKEELDEHKLVHEEDEDEEKSRDSIATVQEEEEEVSQDGYDEMTVLDERCVDQIPQRKQHLNIPLLKNNYETTQSPNDLENGSENDTNQSSTQSETNYKCLSCNVYFQSQSDIKMHAHTQYFCKYFCKRCSRQFNTKGGFVVHVLQHDIKQTTKLSYKCDKCPCSFEDCFQLKRHYVSAHNVLTESSTKPIIKNKDSADNDSAAEALPSTSAIAPPLDKMDPSNPITGPIPIFDCDVCYDVFASAKSLHRHKALHRELDEKKGSSNSVTICIDDDDDVQVVQRDTWLTPHEAVSNFTSSIKNPRSNLFKFSEDVLPPLTPIYSNNKSMPSLQESECTLVEPTVVENSELTAQITQMLGGQPMKPIPKINSLQRVPISVRQPVKTNLRAIAPHPAKSKSSEEVPVSVGSTALSAGDKNKLLKRALNSGTSSSLMSGNQNYNMVNQNSIPVGSLPQMPKPLLPFSSLNQQPVNSGVVATEASTSKGKMMLNSNISISEQASILKSLNLSGLDPNQTVYVLVPTSELNKNEESSMDSTISKPKNKNQSVSDNFKSVIDTDLPIDISGEFGQNTSYYTEDILNSLETGQEDKSEFVMPIITNIGTVSEESSNTKEKIRKDPVSMYESEFAKFLLQSNDSLRPLSQPSKKVKSYAINFKQSSPDIIVLDENSSNNEASSSPERQDTYSEDEVLQSVDGNSGSYVDLPPVIPGPLSVSTDVTSQTNTKPSDEYPQPNAMPKIFVKKLIDLLDVNRKSPEESQQQNMGPIEYCNLCNELFHNWLNYKQHMEREHNKFACKFFKCFILDTAEKHKEHMELLHRCRRCQGDFRSLVTHDKYCSFPPNRGLAALKESSNQDIVSDTSKVLS